MLASSSFKGSPQKKHRPDYRYSIFLSFDSDLGFWVVGGTAVAIEGALVGFFVSIALGG